MRWGVCVCHSVATPALLALLALVTIAHAIHRPHHHRLCHLCRRRRHLVAAILAVAASPRRRFRAGLAFKNYAAHSLCRQTRNTAVAASPLLSGRHLAEEIGDDGAQSTLSALQLSLLS